jgi:hypothetical protein
MMVACTVEVEGTPELPPPPEELLLESELPDDPPPPQAASAIVANRVSAPSLKFGNSVDTFFKMTPQVRQAPAFQS